MNPLTILVVEDRANHIADCKAMLEETLPKLPIQVNVLWTNNLEEAASLLPQADAVMTDVFFPAAPGESDEEPNGQAVVSRCLDQSKPVVWVTSTYHHGKKTEPVSLWGRERGLDMFDCRSDESNCDNDVEGQHKPWKRALYGLFYLILALEGGNCTVSNGVLKHEEYYVGARIKRFAYDYLHSGTEGSCSTSDPVWSRMLDLGFPRN